MHDRLATYHTGYGFEYTNHLLLKEDLGQRLAISTQTICFTSAMLHGVGLNSKPKNTSTAQVSASQVPSRCMKSQPHYM